MGVTDFMSNQKDIKMGAGTPVMFLQASTDSIVNGGQLSELLLNYSQPVYAVWHAGQIGFTQQGRLVADAKDGLPLAGWAPGLSLETSW